MSSNRSGRPTERSTAGRGNSRPSLIDLGALIAILLCFVAIYTLAGPAALIPIASATMALFSLWKGRNSRL
jgi:hypothetical protein